MARPRTRKARNATLPGVDVSESVVADTEVEIPDALDPQLIQRLLIPPSPPNYEFDLIALGDITYEPTGETPEPGMVESVINFGIMEPIHVEFDRQLGRYIIKDGRRRYLAARDAGLERIPSIISSDVLGAPVVRLVTSGRRRENLAAEYLAVQRVLELAEAESLGIYQQLARVTGLPVERIQACLTLRKLIDPLFEGLRSCSYAGSIALAAAKLNRDLQEQLADILEREGTLTMADVRTVKGAKSSGAARAQAQFSFTKWRPVVQDAVEKLRPALAATDGLPAATILPPEVSAVIDVAHETLRSLAALLEVAAGDDEDDGGPEVPPDEDRE